MQGTRSLREYRGSSHPRLVPLTVVLLAITAGVWSLVPSHVARAIGRNRATPVSVETSSATPAPAATSPTPATTEPIVSSPPAAATATSTAPAVTTSCADALSYLAAHAAPGFLASCDPGNSLGRYGYTCWNVAPECGDGGRVIHIACPAPFVYENEAHNSWALIGQGARIDPYGQGSLAERAFCDRLR